nr:MAG TPA: hypothetical protein [Caudoviricetes sp.]
MQIPLSFFSPIFERNNPHESKRQILLFSCFYDIS